MSKISKTAVLTALCFFTAHILAQSSAEQKKPDEKQQMLWEKLGSQIRDIDQHLDGAMGIAIEDLTTGQKYFLHEDAVFAQASSIKICVLAELYHQNQEALGGKPGKAMLTDLYTMDAKD